MRARKRTSIEDIYHDAIGAVANFVASKDYLSHWDPGLVRATRTESIQLQIGRDALQRYVNAVAQARSAVARASAYAPTLAAYLNQASATFDQQTDDIIAELRRLLGEV